MKHITGFFSRLLFGIGAAGVLCVASLVMSMIGYIFSFVALVIIITVFTYDRKEYNGEES